MYSIYIYTLYIYSCIYIYINKYIIHKYDGTHDEHLAEPTDLLEGRGTHEGFPTAEGEFLEEAEAWRPSRWVTPVPPSLVAYWKTGKGKIALMSMLNGITIVYVLHDSNSIWSNIFRYEDIVLTSSLYCFSCIQHIHFSLSGWPNSGQVWSLRTNLQILQRNVLVRFKSMTQSGALAVDQAATSTGARGR